MLEFELPDGSAVVVADLLLLGVEAHALADDGELNETGKARINADDCFAALERMYKLCTGGWACTAMLAGMSISNDICYVVIV